MKDERGASLIEVVTGLALAGLLLSAITTATFRVAQGFDNSNAQIAANRSFQDAVSFLSGDVQMAKYTTLVDGDTAVATLTVYWTDYYNNSSTGHLCSYALDGTDLQRTCDGVTSVVASSVTGAAFSLSGRTITASLTVSATEGPRVFTETKTFRFQLRPQL